MPPYLTVDGYIAGIAAKGGCYLCGASKRHETEVIIDTSVDIMFEGRILVCEACVREMGSVLGLVDSDQVAELRDQVTEARAAQNVAESNATEAKRLASSALAHAAEQANSADVSTALARADEAERERTKVEAELNETRAELGKVRTERDEAEAAEVTLRQQQDGSDDEEVVRDASTGRFVTDDEGDDNPDGTVVEKVHRKRAAKKPANHKESA